MVGLSSTEAMSEEYPVTTPDKLTAQQQLWLDEWKIIASSLQTFGTKRFAQLTVFMAATGFLIAAITKESGLDAQIAFTLKSGGMVLAGLFAIMEYSALKYWTAYERRARTIEQEFLPELSLMRDVQAGKESWWRRLIFSATAATFAVYALVAVGWLVWLMLA